MNARQRRIKKRAFARWFSKDHWSSAAVMMKHHLAETDAYRQHLSEALKPKLAELFPALTSMTEGNQLWVKRVYPADLDAAEVKAACPDISKILHDEHNARVLRVNCDSLTDTLRCMKSEDTQHLRFAFDPTTNLMEMTDMTTGKKSLHQITNLTEENKRKIMDPGLGVPSMSAHVIASEKEFIETYGQPREVTQEEANRALDTFSPPVWLEVVRVKQ